MNKEQYLEQLYQKSGYCPCPQLVELYEKKKTAQGLEAKCAFFKSNADLENPREEDREFLEQAKRTFEDFGNAVREYHHSLYQHASRNKLYFALHDAEKEKISESLSFAKAKRLIKEDKHILTAHCNSCEQQVDVF